MDVAKPRPLANDPEVTESLIRQHKITGDEYERILGALGRPPTYTELGVFSVMWSEHCSYKSSRVHLKTLPTRGPRVIQGPGENAGVVDIGDGFAAVFKIESHNHPSYIEPYQGAATGVGGILRDVFTMGARPIASLNSLRFGRPDHPRTPELVRGVVAGIGGYGNCFGVPTVGGEVQFDESYDGNILVNAFTCGVARTDRIFYGKASGLGNSILYIGAKTGRDGIHGATMASDEFEEGGPAQRPTMQVGDPFVGKLLLEACLELFSEDVLEGIQDMGAAGLTSSSVEMAGRAGNGIELDLDLIPRRAYAMTPYEILLSESQERMLLVAKKGREERVLEICKKWELDAAVVGVVTDTRRWVVKATPGYDPLKPEGVARQARVICDLPVSALADDAPVYDRPQSLRPTSTRATATTSALAAEYDFVADLLSLCESPNVGSKRAVFRQYDHIVRGGTVVRPGSDAAVVRVPCERDGLTTFKYLAFSVDGNGRFCELDPKAGASMIVAEACRNLVCSGAEPIGLSDCLNFGNPERPEVMAQFRDSVAGLKLACEALGVPIVSGNVSLYNETALASGSRSILPTPTIAAVGLIGDPDDVVRGWFSGSGHVILLLGDPTFALDVSLYGSEYFLKQTGQLGASCPRIDLDAERNLQRALLELARSKWLRSAHDVSDGGLAVALAECCAGGPDATLDVGARVDLSRQKDSIYDRALLFGEAPSRVVVSTERSKAAAVIETAQAHGVPVLELGVTGGHTLSVALVERHETHIPSAFHVEVSQLRHARERCLDGVLPATGPRS